MQLTIFTKRMSMCLKIALKNSLSSQNASKEYLVIPNSVQNQKKYKGKIQNRGSTETVLYKNKRQKNVSQRSVQSLMTGHTRRVHCDVIGKTEKSVDNKVINSDLTISMKKLQSAFNPAIQIVFADTVVLLSIEFTKRWFQSKLLIAMFYHLVFQQLASFQKLSTRIACPCESNQPRYKTSSESDESILLYKYVANRKISHHIKFSCSVTIHAFFQSNI